MEIHIKGSGPTKSFSVSGIDSSMTVLDFKKKCEAECGLSAAFQRLFLKGKLLRDEDTLEVSKIGDKATLFLVKGASGSGDSGGGASASTSKAAEPKKEEEPLVSVPCAAGCGFFGTARTENYCSSCYGKKKKDGGKPAEKAPEKPKEACEGAKDGKEKQEGEVVEPEGPMREEQKDKTKCFKCTKKCGLTGIECRCGYTFCSKHRYAEDHDCDFDHKAAGRAIVAKNNQSAAITERDLLDDA